MGHSWRSYLAVLLANATMLAATVSLLISIARTGTLVTKYRETLNTIHDSEMELVNIRDLHSQATQSSVTTHIPGQVPNVSTPLDSGVEIGSGSSSGSEDTRLESSSGEYQVGSGNDDGELAAWETEGTASGSSDRQPRAPRQRRQNGNESSSFEDFRFPGSLTSASGESSSGNGSSEDELACLDQDVYCCDGCDASDPECADCLEMSGFEVSMSRYKPAVRQCCPYTVEKGLAPGLITVFGVSLLTAVLGLLQTAWQLFEVCRNGHVDEDEGTEDGQAEKPTTRFEWVPRPTSRFKKCIRWVKMAISGTTEDQIKTKAYMKIRKRPCGCLSVPFNYQSNTGWTPSGENKCSSCWDFWSVGPLEGECTHSHPLDSCFGFFCITPFCCCRHTGTGNNQYSEGDYGIVATSTSCCFAIVCSPIYAAILVAKLPFALLYWLYAGLERCAYSSNCGSEDVNPGPCAAIRNVNRRVFGEDDPDESQRMELLPVLPSPAFLILPACMNIPTLVSWIATAYSVGRTIEGGLQCYGCSERHLYATPQEELSTLTEEAARFGQATSLISLAATLSAYWTIAAAQPDQTLWEATVQKSEAIAVALGIKDPDPLASPDGPSKPVFDAEQNTFSVQPPSNKPDYADVKVIYTLDGTEPKFVPATGLPDPNSTTEELDATGITNAVPNQLDVVCKAKVIGTDGISRSLWAGSPTVSSDPVKRLTRPILKKNRNRITISTDHADASIVTATWRGMDVQPTKNAATDSPFDVFFPADGLSAGTSVTLDVVVSGLNKVTARSSIVATLAAAKKPASRTNDGKVGFDLEEGTAVRFSWDAPVKTADSGTQLKHGDEIKVDASSPGKKTLYLYVSEVGMAPKMFEKTFVVPEMQAASAAIDDDASLGKCTREENQFIRITAPTATLPKLPSAQNREASFDGFNLGLDGANNDANVNADLGLDVEDSDDDNDVDLDADVDVDADLGLEVEDSDDDNDVDLDADVDVDAEAFLGFEIGTGEMDATGESFDGFNDGSIMETSFQKSNHSAKSRSSDGYLDVSKGPSSGNGDDDEEKEIFAGAEGLARVIYSWDGVPQEGVRGTYARPENGIIELDCSTPGPKTLYVMALKPGFAPSVQEQTFTVEQIKAPSIERVGSAPSLSIAPSTEEEQVTLQYSWQGRLPPADSNDGIATPPHSIACDSKSTIPLTADICASPGEKVLHVRCTKPGFASVDSKYTFSIAESAPPAMERNDDGEIVIDDSTLNAKATMRFSWNPADKEMLRNTNGSADASVQIYVRGKPIVVLENDESESASQLTSDRTLCMCVLEDGFAPHYSERSFAVGQAALPTFRFDKSDSKFATLKKESGTTVFYSWEKSLEDLPASKRSENRDDGIFECTADKVELPPHMLDVAGTKTLHVLSTSSAGGLVPSSHAFTFEIVPADRPTIEQDSVSASLKITAAPGTEIFYRWNSPVVAAGSGGEDGESNQYKYDADGSPVIDIPQDVLSGAEPGLEQKLHVRATQNGRSPSAVEYPVKIEASIENAPAFTAGCMRIESELRFEEGSFADTDTREDAKLPDGALLFVTIDGSTPSKETGIDCTETKTLPFDAVVGNDVALQWLVTRRNRVDSRGTKTFPIRGPPNIMNSEPGDPASVQISAIPAATISFSWAKGESGTDIVFGDSGVETIPVPANVLEEPDDGLTKTMYVCVATAGVGRATHAHAINISRLDPPGLESTLREREIDGAPLFESVLSADGGVPDAVIQYKVVPAPALVDPDGTDDAEQQLNEAEALVAFVNHNGQSVNFKAELGSRIVANVTAPGFLKSLLIRKTLPSKQAPKPQMELTKHGISITFGADEDVADAPIVVKFAFLVTHEKLLNPKAGKDATINPLELSDVSSDRRVNGSEMEPAGASASVAELGVGWGEFTWKLPTKPKPTTGTLRFSTDKSPNTQLPKREELAKKFGADSTQKVEKVVILRVWTYVEAFGTFARSSLSDLAVEVLNIPTAKLIDTWVKSGNDGN